MLRQEDRYVSPRQAFSTDLSRFIQQQQSINSEILLMGDFNETVTTLESGMTKVMHECGLHDLMRHHLDDETDFATYVRGRERIDYVLASDLVMQSLVRACYEPFKQRTTRGDHRSIVLDFQMNMLFGNETQPLGPIATREFTTKDLASNRQYINAKHEYLVQHNFATRLQRLNEDWNPEALERLDSDFQRAGKHAANSCIRKPRNVAYVKQLSRLRKHKNILLKSISQIRLGTSFQSAIQRLQDPDDPFEAPLTVDECNVELRKIQRQIKEMTQDAVHQRQNEQKDALDTALKQGDKKTAKSIRRRMAAERTKDMYKKLRMCRGAERGGITRLDVPMDSSNTDYQNCQEWLTIETPAEIEDRLLQRNQVHFGQAHGTFPTIPPFSEWVDWQASTHTSELILEGNWKNPELDELSQCLVDHMKARTELDEIKGPLTEEDWIGKIKSWPEGTSTSPSGFHLSHSKALVAAHDLDPDEDSDAYSELEDKRNDLIRWQVAMLNAAINHKHSLARWQHIVNVMILKEPNNLRIHRLRVIHIYEHDYNLILATKWREMIRNCARDKCLNNSQFGAVPGRDAILPTMIEEFQYEISRASKRPLVHLDYDATACYDRIIMNFGGLASRCYGQNRSIVYINAKTLQEAKYYLKTQLGVLERSYKHCSFFPIYGSGHGAGNSPAIWCVVSSILFDTYESGANGAFFQSPDGSVKVKVYMIGFVDDTSGSVNDFMLDTSAPPAHYINLATNDAQRWNDVLSLSGGALQKTKCSYHFVYYRFTIDGLPLLEGGRFGPKIMIEFTPGDDPAPLQQLSSYESHKTLGVQKAPFATNTRLHQALAKKNKTHTNTVASSPFTPVEAWSYYHAIYLPSITYPFLSSSIKKSSCQELQREFKNVLLPKCGFNRHTPNVVVYGSADYGGIGLRQLDVERGISQVYQLLACLRSGGIESQLALIMISWGQCLAGIGDPILTNTTTPLPHLEPMTWLPSVRQFLLEIECTIEISQPFLPNLQRDNDCFLMDQAISAGFTGKDLRLLNACRLFLGVVLLSDIATLDGKHISPNAINGIKSTVSEPKGLLPYQSKPGPQSWALWRRFLRTFTGPGRTNSTLSTSLGRWLHTGTSTHRLWHQYLSKATSELFVWTDTGLFQRYIYHVSVFLPTNSTVPTIPSASIPVATRQHAAGSLVLLGYSHAITPPPTSPPTDFGAYLGKLPDWERVLLSDSVLFTDFEALKILLQGTADADSDLELYLCSDGSAPMFCGSFGCVCSTTEGIPLFQISGPAPGSRTTSYRAETYGLLALLRFVFHFCSYHGLHLPLRLNFSLIR